MPPEPWTVANVSGLERADPGIRHVEPSVGAEMALLGLMAAAMLPFALPLVAGPRGTGIAAALQQAAQDRTLRLATGFVGVGLVLFQVSLSAGARLAQRRPRSLRAWRALHRLTGLPMLLILALHTGGNPGVNLNLALTVVLAGMMFLTQAGHVAKARARERAASAPHNLRAQRTHAALNGSAGVVHLAGFQLHVLLAVVATILLGAHVLAVYYF